jgi:hypothetical protein
LPRISRSRCKAASALPLLHRITFGWTRPIA